MKGFGPLEKVLILICVFIAAIAAVSLLHDVVVADLLSRAVAP